LEDYSFSEQLSPDLESGFQVSLFNEPAHLLLQDREGWHAFYAINNKHKRVDALLNVHLQHGVARSLLKSPFGSIEFSSRLPLNTLFHFITFVESRLKSKGAESVVLKNPADLYNASRAAILQVFLSNHGYHISEAETGCMVATVDASLQNSDSWEKRKLRQAQEAGLAFKKISIEQLDEIYFFILACRKQKNYSLSMSLSDLRQTITTFPDRFFLFGAYLQDKIIAAAITVRVTDDVLYNFYVDHDMAYDQLSPVVFVVDGILNFCRERKLPWLDLGTSAVAGKPNFGLLDFKMRLGGMPTPKLTFTKVLD
jgi:hypothetical protein